MIKIKQYITIFIGILLIAISYNLFFSPYHLVTGGISGLAIVVKNLLFIEESKFIFISNIILLIISLVVLGKNLTKKTIIGSILLPICIELTSNITNYVKIDDLEFLIMAIIGGILSGIGYGMLFKNNYTSGGTDILNQIAEKKFKIPISSSMIYIDGLITLLGGLVFGIEALVYSIISLLLISIISNNTYLGVDKNKVFYIESTKYKEIKKYLTEELKYDITIFDVKGGYSNRKRKLILCSIKTSDYYKVKTGLETIDPNIFITITKNYELLNENLMVPKEI